MSLQHEDLAPDYNEDQVAEYLARHPDFLAHRPDLLAQLKIPHDTGGAVSMIEHQVKVLQSQSEKYRKQLEDLILVARENDHLNKRLHRLTLGLIEARNLDEVLNTLQDQLRDQFQADAVELKLFSSEELAAHAGEPGPALFNDFMKSDRPSCGSLQPDQLHYLFGSQAGETGSAALIPIKTSQLVGILAIGSRDENRFHEGKGLDFLIRLGELVSLTLQAVSSPGV